jgi:diguanylate cyclase (GGDEF)-like protein
MARLNAIGTHDHLLLAPGRGAPADQTSLLLSVLLGVGLLALTLTAISPSVQGEREPILVAGLAGLLCAQALVVMRILLGRRRNATLRSDLLATQARLYVIVSNLSGAVLVEDDRGRIVLINEAFCRMFLHDRRPAEFLGRERARVVAAIADQFWYPEQFGERRLALLSLGPPLTGDELSMVDGRTLEFDFVPVTMEGRTLGYLWVFRNITERKLREAELFRLATTDALIGIYNRRYFLEQLVLEVSRIRRFGEPGTLLMADLDHFKEVNDRHGHATGDAVLKHFVAIARGTLRKIDFIGRIGGEEFAIFLPGSDAAGALETAERLRLKLAASAVATCTGPVQVTVSIGVTIVSSSDTIPDPILSRADQALYAAKAAGRNRVRLHLPDEVELTQT